MLDHNAHIKRDLAKNKKGDLVYHRKYRKQSKKWDVTPTLTMKKFLYIPKLLHEIRERESHGDRIKNHVMLPSDHPARIQCIIGHTEPLATSEIAIKKSRFTYCIETHSKVVRIRHMCVRTCKLHALLILLET